MAKRRIAIVGGGMAGLAAAFELTDTQSLRDQYDVTIYQMGWRLGGKCASGREVDQKKDGRIVEHGLHIWFGFYENAFRLLRRAYAEWAPNPRPRIDTVEKAMKAYELARIGYPDPIYFHPPTSGGYPGDGRNEISPWDAIVNLIVRLVDAVSSIGEGVVHGVQQVELGHVTGALARLAQRADTDWIPQSLLLSGRQRADLKVCLFVARDWATWLGGQGPTEFRRSVPDMLTLLRQANASLAPASASEIAGSPAALMAQLMDLGCALLAGLVFDLLLGGAELDDINGVDFRAWLLGHGARRDTVDNSPIVAALYDSTFQYDIASGRADYGAGTAAQTVLRMIGTYKQAFSFKAQAGFGEAVIAPIAGVLAQRGVTVKYFHRLRRAALSADGHTLTSLDFELQAKTTKGCYEAVRFSEDHELWYWPSRPDTDQLVGNGLLLTPEQQRAEFESYWCPTTNPYSLPEDERALRIMQGATGDNGFDEAILALPLGSIAQSDGNPGPCRDSIAANPRFSAMVRSLKLVPTVSLQLWSTWTMEELNSDRAAASVSGPQPLDIWADMSQLLDCCTTTIESSDDRSKVTAARSLHFLTGVLASDLFQVPASHLLVPSEAAHAARQTSVDWLTKYVASIWPNAVDEDGKFDWSTLYSPNGKPADANRIDDQYFVANVDPAACCVASTSGTGRLRLATDESGASHLFLAGAWARTGFDNECVESAVMSGMQAARAICGSPQTVPGEGFLHAGTWGFDLCGLVKTAAAAAWTVLFATDRSEMPATPKADGERVSETASIEAMRERI